MFICWVVGNLIIFFFFGVDVEFELLFIIFGEYVDIGIIFVYYYD